MRDKLIKRIPRKKDSDFSKIAESVEKVLGSGVVRKFSEVKFISTGILSIDWAMGGGVPVSRLTEIFGDFSSGKTLLGMHLLKETLRLGGLPVFIDVERSFSIHMAQNLGIDLKRILYLQPPDLEEVFESMDTVIKEAPAKGLLTIVWDSIAETSPKKELDSEVGTAEMGLRARVVSRGLRRLMPKIANRNIVLLFTNQLRHRIGILFGPSWTTAGGEGPRICSSIRGKLAKKQKMMDGKKIIGQFGELEIVKNKLAPPFRKVKFAVNFKKGILPLSGYLDCLVEREAVIQKGSWYQFGDVKFQKRDFPGILKSYPELKDPKFGE